MIRPGICIGGPANGTRVDVDDCFDYVNIGDTPEFRYDPNSEINYVPVATTWTYQVTRKLTVGGLIICTHQL
jgi:hypothetical protein